RGWRRRADGYCAAGPAAGRRVPPGRQPPPGGRPRAGAGHPPPCEGGTGASGGSRRRPPTPPPRPPPPPPARPSGGHLALITVGVLQARRVADPRGQRLAGPGTHAPQVVHALDQVAPAIHQALAGLLPGLLAPVDHAPHLVEGFDHQHELVVEGTGLGGDLLGVAVLVLVA